MGRVATVASRTALLVVLLCACDRGRSTKPYYLPPKQQSPAVMVDSEALSVTVNPYNSFALHLRETYEDGGAILVNYDSVELPLVADGRQVASTLLMRLYYVQASVRGSSTIVEFGVLLPAGGYSVLSGSATCEEVVPADLRVLELHDYMEPGARRDRAAIRATGRSWLLPIAADVLGADPVGRFLLVADTGRGAVFSLLLDGSDRLEQVWGVDEHQQAVVRQQAFMKTMCSADDEILHVMMPGGPCDPCQFVVMWASRSDCQMRRIEVLEYPALEWLRKTGWVECAREAWLPKSIGQ